MSNTPSKHPVIATRIGIAANTLLALGKGIVGLYTGSQALITDAVHSASDIVSSFIALFGMKIAEKPPDREHPYGHGKAEHVASIIVSVVLIVVGIEMAINAGRLFFAPPPPSPGGIALFFALFSVFLKEGMFHYKYRLGKIHRRPLLITEAWHHRSDALSSLAAVVGIGLTLLARRFGTDLLLYGDAAAGLIVSFMIVHVGFSLAKQSSLIMMEQVVSENKTAKFIATARSVSGVLRVDELLARSHARYVIIDVRVSVDPHLTVEVGHDVGKQVKKYLLQQHAEVEDVFVHINPYTPR